MATSTRIAVKALSRCQRRVLNSSVPAFTAASHIVPWSLLPVRAFAAAKTQKKVFSHEKKKEEKVKVEKKERVIVDDKDRHKPFGLTAWAPVDDVYMVRYFPKPVFEAGVAMEMLKSFQKLDFTPLDQPVYVDLKLDMKLEKKRKVDPFVSTVHLPHPFKTDPNTVVVFTENPDQAKLALENGALFAGGADLIQRILDDEVAADFYIAVPDVLSKLAPLKSKLRKKFPKAKRGSVGVNIPKMLDLFKMGHEYLVERECYVITMIGTLDMPKEHLYGNLQTIVADVCSHRPASYGHFIDRAIVSAQTTEALRFNSVDVLPIVPEKKQA